MGKHHKGDCSIAIAWCDECKSVHVGVFDKDAEMVAMGDIPDVEVLISMLREAKEISERPQLLQ